MTPHISPAAAGATTAAFPVVGIPVRRIVIAGRATHAETTGMTAPDHEADDHAARR